MLFNVRNRHFYVSIRALFLSFRVLLTCLIKKSSDALGYTRFNNLFSLTPHVVGSMERFIYEYFIDPIWSRSGYNIVNTLTYAIIAIVSVYVIYHKMHGKIRIDESFIRSVMCFVLFGSTLRVVTDSIDAGVMKPITPIHELILNSHIYDYGYFTVTPGIYIVVASILLFFIAVLYKLKRMDLLGYVGLVLWFPHFLLILPFMKYWIYTFPVLAMAAVPAYLALKFFKDRTLASIVAAHSLDGAATFFAIDIFPRFTGIGYGEQHVFSGAIGFFSGSYFTFYLVKVAISFLAAWLLMKENIKDEERNYIALVLMIVGFAPGLRDVLRMGCGA